MLNEQNQYHIQTATQMLLRYYHDMAERPVRSLLAPGAVLAQLPETAPELGEDLGSIMADVEDQIIPGLTHWQHPGFMTLFPSNASLPSLLGEYIAAGVAVNCMMWDTSPAAAELETRVLDWMGKMLGLPNTFQGVIQDTASTGTLTAIIAAREKASVGKSSKEGMSACGRMILYTSGQAHYSIEKGAMAAGIGSENIRKVAVKSDFSMDSVALQSAIEEDIAKGYQPFMVVAALGTTSTLAFDPLAEIGMICHQFSLWLHVDAAYAGNAFILPEYQHYLDGILLADSLVVNPHKWLFTHFDCSLLYVRDPNHLIKTFSADPAYLRSTLHPAVRHYKDWGLPLGRRFRALKLWFVIRAYGRKGLQEKLRFHISLATIMEQHFRAHSYWHFVAPPAMNVLVVQWVPKDHPVAELSKLNKILLEAINADGRFYLSGTTLNDQFVIRIVPAQTEVTEKHVLDLLELMEYQVAQISAAG